MTNGREDPVEVPPLVSVIVPCYNDEKYIGDAIASVLRQTVAKLELIVVDDGSTDRSLQIVREIAASDPRRVRWRTGPNRGACAARNSGLASSRGQYVQWLDADDYLDDTKIEDQLRTAARNPGAVVYGPWFNEIQIGAKTCFSPTYGRRPVADPLAEQLRAFLAPLHAYLAPRQVLEGAALWDETLAADQDGDFFLRLMLRGIRFVHAPGGAAGWRHHQGIRVSTQRTEAATRSRYDVCCRVIEQLRCRGELSPYAELLAQRLDACAQMAAMLDSGLARRCLAKAREIRPGYRPRGRAAYRILRRFLHLRWCEDLRGARQRLRRMASLGRPVAPRWLLDQRE